MPPPPQGQPYTPHPTIIDRNTICEFALQAAPNVLFGRYKQYGQVHTSGRLFSFPSTLTTYPLPILHSLACSRGVRSSAR